MANLIPNVSQKDIEQAQAHQQRQQQQLNKDLKQNLGFDVNDMANMSEAELEAKIMGGFQGAHAQAMAQADKQMAAMASVGITEADMKKMEKMNDKQMEAYMKKRLAENGYTEADLERAIKGAGLKVMSEAEVKAEQKRQQQNQAEGDAMAYFHDTQQAYLDQMPITKKKMDEALQSALSKIKPITEKYKPIIGEASTKASQWEEVARETVTEEELKSWQRKADALMRDYRKEAYHIWLEYIGVAQGHLKFLMGYATAADDARAKMPSMTGNAATDQLQRMSNYALSVAQQYLSVTASEPLLLGSN